VRSEADVRFLRAIAIGAAAGIPVTWAVLTAIFAVTTDAELVTIAGYSALPAIFCGPFLGGLFTTALANARNERDEHGHAAEAEPDVEERTAA